MDKELTEDSEDSVEVEDAGKRAVPRERGQRLQMERRRERGERRREREGEKEEYDEILFMTSARPAALTFEREMKRKHPARRIP